MMTTEPLAYDLYTANKSPDFAIFFNLAHDNLEKFVKSIDPTIVNPLKEPKKLSDRVFTYLREYLWKGNSQNKNKDGHIILAEERSIMIEMLLKLRGLRNFHSHIWHKNDSLEFSDLLFRFVMTLHDTSVSLVSATVSKNASLYQRQRDEYPLFKLHNNKYFITQEGRLYFLSFFLNKGEMQSLLQQTKGSKQNNLPEFKFKHEIFTCYCHREGSNWDSTSNLTADTHISLENSDKRILYNRQAHRIINYLNDDPITSVSDLIPLLFEKSGKIEIVSNAESLIQFIESKNLLSGIHLCVLKPDFTENLNASVTNKEVNELKKSKEHKIREGWIELSFKNSTWVFEISYSALRSIIIDIVTGRKIHYRNPDGKFTEDQAESHFKKVLNDCISNREYLYYELRKAGEKPVSNNSFAIKKKFSSVFIDYDRYSDSINDIYLSSEQLRHLPIAATPKIEDKLIEWHQLFTQGKKNEVFKRIQLLNLIRPASQSFDTSIYVGLLKNGKKKVIPASQKAEPMLFQLSYYYKEQTRKNRRPDAFLEWAAQYLMDFDLSKEWYWEAERYVFDKKLGKEETGERLRKDLIYTKKLPENYRVRTLGEAVTIGIPKKRNPTGSRDFYKLRLNARLLLYLLVIQSRGDMGPDCDLSSFLIQISIDLEHILNNKPNSTILLEDFAIPGYLKTPSRKNNTSTLEQEINKFINTKIEWIEDCLTNKDKYTRNQKNQIIFDAYLLFDFSNTEGGKFFRKNEFQQMSVCHYLLNQEGYDVPSKISNFYKLRNRMPSEIFDIINEASTLDELFTSVLNDRKSYLRNILNNQVYTGIPTRLLRKLADALQIKLPTHLLTPINQQNRIELTIKNREHIPFVVHPLLALKYFYREEFKAGCFSPNPEPGKKNYRNILKEFREHFPDNPLPKENYFSERIDRFLPPDVLKLATDNEVGKYIKEQKKWKGFLLETKTTDMLLWGLALQYISKYDDILYAQLSTLKEKNTLELSHIFSMPVQVELKKETVESLKAGYEPKFQGEYLYTETEKASLPETIYLKLFIHQVDDYFFRKQKDNLYQLACHFVNRRKEELELYASRTDISEKIRLWPDGSESNPVLLGDLINERKICAGFGRELMQYILDFERRIITDYARNRTGTTYDQLTDIERKTKNHQVISEKVGSKPYLRFDLLSSLASMDNSVFEKLRIIRNQCMHSSIPLNGSFRALSMPGTDIAGLLHINVPIGKDRSRENEYERGRENAVN